MKINYILAIMAGVAAGVFKLSMSMTALDFFVAFGFAFTLSLTAYDLTMNFREWVIRSRQVQYNLDD